MRRINLPSSSPLLHALPGILRSGWEWFVLGLLVLLFPLVQIGVRAQYGDAPRNLHWAMVAAENPGFLINDINPYDMTDGFVPDPPALAPRGKARTTGPLFHPWWGPVPIILMASVWWLTASRELMALVVPLAAAGTVLASYGLGCWLVDRRTGLWTAVFVGLFPLFYEHGIISYSEAISALFLLLAVWSYLSGKTLLTVFLGTLTVLCKLDMGVVYSGVIGSCLIYRLSSQHDWRSLRHTLLALLLPLLVLAGWFWLRTGSPLPSGTGRGLSVEVFLFLAPEMLEMLFYIPWYGALLTLTVIGFCVARGLASPHVHGEKRVVLVSWVALGFMVLLVYTATPGASNSPRVIVPGLPGLALLFAAGWKSLPSQWARRTMFYLVACFVIINGVITYYGIEQARYYHTFDEVWQVLREQPRGFVLTNAYWMTVWQTCQPVTWFEGDSHFQENILHNRDNFVRYTSQNPIRYVIVPRPGTRAAITYPLIQVNTAHLYSDDVVAYLRDQGQHIPVPPYYDLYVLPPPQQSEP